jgi:hypothetical protein
MDPRLQWPSLQASPDGDQVVSSGVFLRREWLAIAGNETSCILFKALYAKD